MDIELKNQSVVEIGKAVGDNVNSMIPQSQALLPAGATAPDVEPMPMNPFDSMMAVLEDVRDGVYALVDKFSDSVSLQQDQIQDQNMAADLSQAASGEDVPPPAEEEEDNRSFMDKAKDKMKNLMGAGGLRGMLVKGGLIFGLLGIAKLMQKYGKEIAEKVAPIVDGIKKFFSAFTDDIGPLFDKAVAMVKDAIGGLLDIFKGLFTGDASTFLSGVKKIFVDFPIKLVSYIGDAFFSLIENALAAFGIESEMVTDIKLFFRQLPEKISELFTNIGLFFTETIPQKLEEIKTSITNFFNDNIVTPIKNLWTDIGNFFTVTVPEKYTEITEKVTGFFTDIVTSIKGFFTDAVSFVTVTIPEKIAEVSKGITDKFTEIKDQIIDFAMAPFRKIKELMQNLLVGILESVEGLPFIGDKAKALKDKILGTGGEAGGETLGTAGTGDASIAENIAQDNQLGNIATGDDGSVIDPKTGKVLKIKDEEAAMMMASELSKSGQGKFEAVNVDPFGPFNEHYQIRKTGEAVAGTGGTTTGGATGGELNGAGAEFVGTGSGTGNGGDVNIMNEGAKVNTISSNQNHMNEGTGTNDKSFNLDLD